MRGKRNILIIDDDAQVIRILQLALEKFNYSVITGKNGKEAIQLAKKVHPDLILMDVHMPHMDGLTACKIIKKNQRKFEFIPIILLTGKGNIDDKLKGLDMGADDYLIKPCELRELIARVRSMIRIKELTEQLQKIKNELIETKQVAAVAATAVTVNHEINTPLTRILVNVENITAQLPKSEFPIYEKHLADITKAANQIGELTKKLVKLSKPSFVHYMQGTPMLNLDSENPVKPSKRNPIPGR